MSYSTDKEKSNFYKYSPKKTGNLDDNSDTSNITNNKKYEEIISDEEIERYITLIQANFRRYILQKKLYNSVNLYMRYIEANFILTKIMISLYKNLFFKRLKQISDESKNKEKIEKELSEYKVYKDKYNDIMEQIKIMQNKNYEINKKYNELTRQLKDLKGKEKVVIIIIAIITIIMTLKKYKIISLFKTR